MTDNDRRKQLKSEYRGSAAEAGVYLIVNERTNRGLLGSTRNLASLRNRIEFAKTTNSPSALDGRLAADVREFGIQAFSLKVLDSFEPETTLSAAQIQLELSALEDLWREKLGAASLYP